ncbi:MAG: hypothetical protein IPO77_22660 [Acidobacteria bacterium]|nr:hypothetical protein [Acidobacteriota bacterium]
MRITRLFSKARGCSPSSSETLTRKISAEDRNRVFGAGWRKGSYAIEPMPEFLFAAKSEFEIVDKPVATNYILGK